MKNKIITLKERIATGKLLPLIGVYDAFSAKLVAKHFEGIFCSGFSFAASFYGLPDEGHISWKDMADFSIRIKQSVPDAHIVVDAEDGFGNEETAATVIRNLEASGISGVLLEDQMRPRKCGHMDNKILQPIEEFSKKLSHVIKAKDDIFVIARTDASDTDDRIARAVEYAGCKADAVMIEAVDSLKTIENLASKIRCPIVVNMIHGGKTPNWTHQQLSEAGVSLVIYSTLCLFNAQYSLQKYLTEFKLQQKIPTDETVTLDECNKLL